jgi:hypothetical protein
MLRSRSQNKSHQFMLPTIMILILLKFYVIPLLGNKLLNMLLKFKTKLEGHTY